MVYENILFFCILILSDDKCQQYKKNSQKKLKYHRKFCLVVLKIVKDKYKLNMKLKKELEK